jgi:hypothetical protein
MAAWVEVTKKRLKLANVKRRLRKREGEAQNRYLNAAFNPNKEKKRGCEKKDCRNDGKVAEAKLRELIHRITKKRVGKEK